jgi:single-strand DNA-binding protein
MQDVNTITLVGRMTRPPERRGQVLAMRLAFTASRKVNDAWEDVPQYVDAVCFGRTADALESLLDKGTQVVVQGRLAWREWEAGDGSKRQAHEIACERVQLVGGRKADGAAPVAPSPAPAVDDHSDIPF